MIIKDTIEEFARNTTTWVTLAIEIVASIVLAFAVFKSILLLSPIKISSRRINADEIRMKFATAVSISLELLLGADVLATAVAPGWDAIGKLAAIATIRTGLNYFLAKELHPNYKTKGFRNPSM